MKTVVQKANIVWNNGEIRMKNAGNQHRTGR